MRCTTCESGDRQPARRARVAERNGATAVVLGVPVKYAFPVARSGSRWRRQSNSTPVSTVYLPVVPSSPKPIGKRLSLPELVDRFEAMASHRRL
jgi:hypothetical protein